MADFKYEAEKYKVMEERSFQKLIRFYLKT